MYNVSYIYIIYISRVTYILEKTFQQKWKICTL